MYSIKKVSRLLGIPTVTIRAWENRYHIVSPDRSDGGHRLYSEADIETLRWLKEQVQEKNMKISEAARLLKQNGAEKPAVKNPEPPFVKAYDDMIDRLYKDLIHFNTMQANEAIDLAFSLYYFEDVFHRILVPVLYRIGAEWEEKKITVAQEHFSSQVILQRFTQFFRVMPVHPYLPKVLSFCPEGEQHHIGLLLFSLFLRKKGVDVIYLGPSTPFSGLTTLIKQKNVSAVAISVTDPVHAEKSENWMEACRSEFPDLKFVLGGKGFAQRPLPASSNIYLADRMDWEVWYESELLQLRRD